MEMLQEIEHLYVKQGDDKDDDEIRILQKFSSTYQNTRDFSTHVHARQFSAFFTFIVTQRLQAREWIQVRPRKTIYSLLVCLRLLLRDSHYQSEFIKLQTISSLAQYFSLSTRDYLTQTSPTLYSVEILTEITNICQKLSSKESHRTDLIDSKIHESLVLLLSASDVTILHCSLHALISLSQRLAANLLKILNIDDVCREMTKQCDGVAILLSQLHSTNGALLTEIVWCLVQLANNTEIACVMRQMGAIPLLISIIQLKKLETDNQSAEIAPASASHKGRSSHTVNSQDETCIYSLKIACCACITELVLNDTNAHHTIQANGLYAIATITLPAALPRNSSRKLVKTIEKLQRCAFRALRFLFTMERNRRLFKRLFPPDLFEMFIDVGHYNRDLAAYKCLVDKVNSYPKPTLDFIRQNISNIDQQKIGYNTIANYTVFDLLGSGSFGSVYKVKKTDAGQSFLAMKEIDVRNSSFGASRKQQDQSAGHVMCELSIIREELRHPNIVRYHKTFLQNDKLYIVMELIEGASLTEYVASLNEKNERFSETRLWNITMQMILALRYLHKEKKIVHRDLTPNNVMLGENDKITITDFGLAKQKKGDVSDMTSTVGTILYTCPELLQNLPYGEKADIWALGCLLYLMCTLKPPFFSTNIVALTCKIVESRYDAIPEGSFSQRLIDVIKMCLTSDPSKRPDILQLTCGIVDVVLVHMDHLVIHEMHLERKIIHEQQRTRRHFTAACNNIQKYHQLFLASQTHMVDDSRVAVDDTGWSSDENEECLYSEVLDNRSMLDNHGPEKQFTLDDTPPSIGADAHSIVDQNEDTNEIIVNESDKSSNRIRPYSQQLSVDIPSIITGTYEEESTHSDGRTYKQMLSLIETVLLQYGYYRLDIVDQSEHDKKPETDEL